MRAALRIQRATFAALEIHLAREQVRQHGAQNQDAAEHRNR